MRPAKTKKAQKGFSLYLALMIMIFILSVNLGISVIIISQLKIIRGIEDSVIALCAADSGIERVLYEDRLSREITGDGLAASNRSGDIGSINGILVTYQADFNDGALSITSVGSFNGTKRAVQVER